MSVAVVAHKEAKESSPTESGGFYAFSSLAYSFAALMLMMAAALKISNEMAEDAQKSVVAEGQLATHVADQTRTAGDADSTNIMMQAGESIADGMASFIGGAAAFHQIRGMSAETDAFNNQERIADQLNDPAFRVERGEAEQVAGDGLAEEDPDVIEKNTRTLADLREQLRRGTFFAGKRATEITGIDEEIPGTGVTLKQVLQSAESDEEFAKLQDALGEERKTAASRLQARQNEAQMRSQMVSSLGQFVAGGAKSGLKFEEAKATQDKAYANAAESVFNVQEQLIKATKDTQQQQSDAFYKTEQDALTTIATIAQVDARA